MKQQNKIKSVIFGCQGFTLTSEERSFFKKENPLGLIIFDRNVRNPDQLKALIEDFRQVVGRSDAPVLVDQEGGRVTRLWPPYWHGLGWNRTYGDWYEENSLKGLKGIQQHAKTLAEDLLSVGINVDCWPCLDVAQANTHEIMAKRCFSDKPDVVAALAEVGIKKALNNGLMPIIKHIPGYGRTTVDPHLGLPVVNIDLTTLDETDFSPFKRVKMPVWGMTAHVIYTALDEKLPATLSPRVLEFIRHQIGFDGFLICDDISMGALKQFGTLGRLASDMIHAGCDCVLHCNGNMDEMKQIAEAVPCLSEASLDRLIIAESLKNGI
ncbi:MAG: glycoside hydrolase family 3 protein [Alphaproteobacteria bacterium]|nr:glycoside hydrolase family 3 protein [Alphaproteobacteria bacterium]